jgi:hypothetical protein
MATLTLCMGLFMGGCVQLYSFDFPDFATCEKERSAQVHRLRGGWAVCALKKHHPTAGAVR